MRSTFVLILCLLAQLSVVAQLVSHATFYSKEGYPFTIYLNGQKMNEEPQTEVRLINLTQPYYSCEAVFEDPTIEPATRKVLQLTDANGNRVDVTFVVERNRKGRMKIGWKSQSLYPKYIEESKSEPTVVVIQNGAAASNVVRETTTTRTVSSTTDGVNLSLGVPGGSVSINAGGQAPVVEQVTTTTAVATEPARPSGQPLPCSGTILSESDYQMALKSVALRTSEQGKLTSAKQIVSSNCLTTDQVRSMVDLLSSEEARLDLAVFAYPFVLDKGSYFKMNGVFAKEESIDEMNRAILGQ